MNCPHRIEPHQIQGLDCIHIFPVVQVDIFSTVRIFYLSLIFFINFEFSLFLNKIYCHIVIIQWLVKRSMKTREQMAGFVRSFAVSQFEKNHSSADERKDSASGKIENMIPNIMLVKVILPKIS